MVTFSRTAKNIELSRIEELERHVKLTFPIEYKVHLQTNNGGQCYPNIFSFFELGNHTESSVNWFFAIFEGEYNNLKEYIDIYKIEEKRLPNHILPIASDPGGNLICISCRESDYGYIYFWDHENEIDHNFSNDNDYSNLFLIATNFASFLEGLY
ncbi:MAG: SMI1/KNR4 family protein [Bacteroidia bacterium]|nr:SMI1/KNR4 family protein [Bacteroidia bacterium]